VSKFKATCLARLERVRRTGRPLLITKRGVPIAQVVPPPPAEAPVTREIALLSREVMGEHRDPADRMIAATAVVHDLTLVTVDERLRSVEGLRTRSG